MDIDHSAIWETYAFAWKVVSREEKLELFKQCLAHKCIYRDPLTVADGYDELANYMMEFHTMVPGGHFVTQEFNAHNNRIMAKWKMCKSDGTVVGDGVSFGEFDDAGKIIAMTGFFEAPTGT